MFFMPKVCSTIKIELLTTTPVNIMKPSIVNISKGCLINKFIIINAIIPPTAAEGTITKTLRVV